MTPIVWVLIVSWTTTQPFIDGCSSCRDFKPSNAVAMQEFVSQKACRNAAAEAQKIAPGLRSICVPKGSAADA